MASLQESLDFSEVKPTERISFVLFFLLGNSWQSHADGSSGEGKKEILIKIFFDFSLPPDLRKTKVLNRLRFRTTFFFSSRELKRATDEVSRDIELKTTFFLPARFFYGCPLHCQTQEQDGGEKGNLLPLGCSLPPSVFLEEEEESIINGGFGGFFPSSF